jgi:hypothetical protein
MPVRNRLELLSAIVGMLHSCGFVVNVRKVYALEYESAELGHLSVRGYCYKAISSRFRKMNSSPRTRRPSARVSHATDSTRFGVVRLTAAIAIAYFIVIA